jgi:hypothetical protein
MGKSRKLEITVPRLHYAGTLRIRAVTENPAHSQILSFEAEKTNMSSSLNIGIYLFAQQEFVVFVHVVARRVMCQVFLEIKPDHEEEFTILRTWYFETMNHHWESQNEQLEGPTFEHIPLQTAPQ